MDLSESDEVCVAFGSLGGFLVFVMSLFFKNISFGQQ